MATSVIVLNTTSSGGGGGGGGAVTVADGADVALGATTDAAATTGSMGTLSAKLRLMTTQLNTMLTLLNGGLPAALSGGALKVDGSAVTQPVSGTVSISANQSVNLNQVAGAGVSTGHGTASGSVRVELPTDGTGVIATVTAVTSITNALPAGTNTIGAVTVATSTTGGATGYNFIAVGGSNQDQQSIKSSAGTLYSVVVTNQNAALRYLKIYNASAPTSASTPIFNIMIPASTTGGGVAFPIPPQGVAFSTAIGIRFTTGQAANDTGAVTSGDCQINAIYS